MVSSIIIHPGYSTLTQKNDISLLKTSTDIIFGEFVSSIQLATREVALHSPAVLSGWGTIILGGATPNNLQFINLVTIGIIECRFRHMWSPYPVKNSEICTLTQLGEGACHGDSGGPLAVQNTLVGIVSWGRPCAIGYPDVYTKVSSYVDWISQHAV